ncbi:hypothetical protein LXL04_038025 [Taraxacum kok-saghyz]
MRGNKEDWTTFRQRRRTTETRFPEQKPGITSFYVSNLHGGTTRDDLWKTCAKLGKLEDIFIAGRKNNSGRFFAFVKFSGVECERTMEELLSNTLCKGVKLMANVSIHPRRTNPSPAIRKNPPPPPPTQRMGHSASFGRGSRSFADVAKGSSVKVIPEIHLSVNENIRTWVDNATLLGEVKNLDTLCNFPAIMDLNGFNVDELKYIGGMKVVLKFNSKRTADVFLANKAIWLKWFGWLGDTRKTQAPMERIAWVRIVGMPLIAMDEANFSKVASNFGTVLVTESPFWNNMDSSQGKACILTSMKKMINEEIMVKLQGVQHTVGISEVEENWLLFKPYAENCQSEQGEDDDDEDEDLERVSETVGDGDKEMEEGEFIPNTDCNVPNFRINLNF